ncbi:unnamed protein product [Prorocentrum cordatum]|uniref:KIF-binding protein n=1 Tax=Prorocentrum cordatum TaxID=2364126 RepID=A0ABN9QB33_9DINO|nr:unnamed protein product [Polarella glacialis]
MGSSMRSLQATTSDFGHGERERRAWPLPTADHRACADLFVLYAYNMYRRRDITRMWQTLCGGYERSMDTYAELLKRNPALKPMLESISAQLKRGAVVGYDKAFIAKHTGGDDAGSAKGRTADADLFKRKPKQAAFDSTFPRAPGPQQPSMMSEASMLISPEKSKDDGIQVTPAHCWGFGSWLWLNWEAGQQMQNTSKHAQRLVSTKFKHPVLTPRLEITGDYLTKYLKEMDGDDSQFKDISPAVAPLSTGTSPGRQPPGEHILSQEAAAAAKGRPGSGQDAASGGPARDVTPAKPRLDVPFCLQRVKPVWLPIKAHRFAAYRAKVLQLLPQKVLQQYIDFEKQGQYPACVKLLESATPGSLNVLSPATLAQNQPLLVETVLQLIVGYSGLCLKNGQGSTAVKLITQALDNMSLSLRDLHPGHRLVIEAYLYDTALSVCYYMPNDVSLSDRAESFFQQASERYLRLKHIHEGHRSEAEYYTQQAAAVCGGWPAGSGALSGGAGALEHLSWLRGQAGPAVPGASGPPQGPRGLHAPSFSRGAHAPDLMPRGQQPRRGSRGRRGAAALECAPGGAAAPEQAARGTGGREAHAQALNKLTDAPVSSLLAVCYHNLAVAGAAAQLCKA